MRRLIALCLLAVVTVIALAAANAASAPPDRPPNVAAENWKPLTKELGVVLSVEAGNRVRGTLMAWVNGEWRPVFVQNPSMPMPAASR